MKNFRNMAIILLVVFTTVILALGVYYKVNMAGTSNSDTKKIVNIEEGTINDIAKTLKDNNLIKNVSIFKVYIKLTNKSNLKAGTYELSENMGVEKIVKILEEGTKYNPNEISITFKEGINIRKIATLISENTNNSYDDVIKKASDETFIDTLINKYWFLTEDIKNKNIYYSLEGYLFPDTYRFNNREVTTEEIFTKMLDEMDKKLAHLKKLSKYKDEINKSDLSVHEIITLASVVELEGAKATDRKGVAGVFYNRLASSAYPTLGSDATTYYASKIDDWSYSLTYKELNDCKNKYNTRCSSNTGLPVGPICNPGIESIEATINPDKHEYYYFVADCNGKVYLTKNSTEHNNIINKLKKEDNWCA